MTELSLSLEDRFCHIVALKRAGMALKAKEAYLKMMPITKTLFQNWLDYNCISISGKTNPKFLIQSIANGRTAFKRTGTY